MAVDSTATSRTASPSSVPTKTFSDPEKNAVASSSADNQPTVAAAPVEKAKGFTVDTVAVDDVFATDVDGDGPDYRGVGWPAATVLLMKSQIGLGVLSLPKVMNTLGFVPGILLIIFLGVITTYGDYEIGRFRNRYPGVHSVGDVGYVMGGVIGREILGWSYWLYQIFNTASGLLACSIAFNALTEHATCTVAFTVVASVIVGIISSARTFKQISWMGWIGICCIVPAILLVTIACAVASRPPQGPAYPAMFDKELKAFNNPTFAQAMVAVVNVLFAYGGSPGFFSIIAEMKNPLDYNKAMLGAQSFSIILYITVSTVLWFYCGQYVASPALGSAGPLLKKIGYGIALPGLLASPIIFSHLAIKFCFVRLLRGSHHLQHSTPTHWITWLSLVVGVQAFAFIIAEVIPFFDDLIGLVGAIFASFFCITLIGFMWLYDNKQKGKTGPSTLGNKLMHANAYMMIVVGMFIFVAGFYGTILSIKHSFASGTVGSPFSCEDNSNSVAKA